MTKPPCMLPDGTDCPRRYIGCKASCRDWHEWLIIHAEEKETIKRNKKKYTDCNTFEADRAKRNNATIHEKSASNARNGVREVKYD